VRAMLIAGGIGFCVGAADDAAAAPAAAAVALFRIGLVLAHLGMGNARRQSLKRPLSAS